ncbi:MAG: hypothetical protein E7097_01635 [Bacteroides sp.]|nr:hypothetical protein [Bacteroides sp.]
MEKRNYVKPLLNSEEFVPQEYIAVCYQLECDYRGYVNGDYHSSGGCGNPENQVIRVDENGNIINIYEKPNDENDDWHFPGYTAELEEITTSTGSYNVTTLIKQRATINWRTYVGDHYMHHSGTIVNKLDSKPNMS